ncbi:hypothetical protein HYC85_013682 [Camellia sinensis]|uniref:RRM domain-containing protein n=1 Tax=Camellia sinensis TaxID=4442 RepID=A0A7J7H5C9_CAMSI|nr:hypothetical protein HYC85_013682 [Camellia sinensis]
MEHQEQEQEHDVYGGEIPDEGEMDADVEMSRAEEEESNSKDLQDMKKRLKEIEEEAGALREMQAKVEKEMGAVQDSSSGSATQAEKEEVDSRSIYVGNVDYACTPEEVQQHFQSCGTVNRVTILTDKFGQPKGFAYVEFVEVEAVQNALLLNESELHGRQLKVSAKRTNVPGMKQYRGRRPNPYFGFPSRRPFKGSKVQAANAVQTVLMMVNLALFVAAAEDPMSCSSSGQQSQKLGYYDRISISLLGVREFKFFGFLHFPALERKKTKMQINKIFVPLVGLELDEDKAAHCLPIHPDGVCSDSEIWDW